MPSFMTFPWNPARAAGRSNRNGSCVDAIDEERFCNTSIRGTSKRVSCCWPAFFSLRKRFPETLCMPLNNNYLPVLANNTLSVGRIPLSHSPGEVGFSSSPRVVLLPLKGKPVLQLCPLSLWSSRFRTNCARARLVGVSTLIRLLLANGRGILGIASGVDATEKHLTPCQAFQKSHVGGLATGHDPDTPRCPCSKRDGTVGGTGRAGASIQ